MRLRNTPRFVLLTVGYAAILQAAYLAALLLRFEGDVPHRFWQGYAEIAPYFTALSLFGFLLSGLYHGLWRYASTVTLFQVFKGVTLSAMVLVMIMFFSADPQFPRSLIVMVWLWELVILGGVRFAWRLSRERLLGPIPTRAIRTLVVGADHTGVHLLQEMRRAHDGAELLTPVGFIDDDSRLTGHMVEGIKVFGTIGELPRVIVERRAEMVIVAVPDMPAKVVREIARYCAEARVRVKTVPGLSSLQQGRTALSQVRDVQIEDLLGRQPVHLDLDEVEGFLSGQCVLVTGAGGSIGAELARQVAAFGPETLVLLDHAENGLYFVQQELLSQFHDLKLHAVVADVRDLGGINNVLQRFRPHVVFHAAAHKHVPLLEANPREAVLNNVVGTRNLVQAADRNGVDKFVLISTDKAVNPTSVMGASKRVCEMLAQSRSQHSRTRFVAVRFGNVLGSDGSVIPLFQRQIQRGGPITVTDPEARRYFMTIPEAVRLVLQAGAMGHGGELFLLDMGEQVRILDLARQLIRMQGLREGEDIEIVFTGLRPGEKLYEELHSDSERTRITRHERILVWDLDAREESGLLTEVMELESLAHTADDAAIKRQFHRLVPEYVEPRHEQIEPVPATPVVDLVSAPMAPAAAPRREWPEMARGVCDAVVAAGLLLLSVPLWILLSLEARRHGAESYLRHEVRLGRTRRRQMRRGRRQSIAIDRRSFGRRTQDLFGAPISCDQFRSDLGPVSRWFTRRRLGTVPFLFNVIRGEMALVGPVPEREETVLRWKGLLPEYERRFTVLPGVTGLAQIAGCDEQDPGGVERRIQYDLHYVDHRSLLLDFRTLLRTALVILQSPRRAARPAPRVAAGTSAVKGVTR